MPSPFNIARAVAAATLVALLPMEPLNAQFDRDWRVFLVPFSHTDVGYTAPVPQVVEDHNRYLDSVMVYVERTRALPEGERFRWTVEIPWVLESWLAERPASHVDAFMQMVRDGEIEIAGMHFGLQTDLTSAEELVQSLYYARELRDRYQVPIRTVLLNDTPGFTWSLAQILPKSGMPYLALGMNSVLSDFYTTTELPNLFHWEAQNGERTLVWRSIDRDWAYLEGRITHNVYGPYSSMKSRLTDFLNGLAEEGYPYDHVYIHAATGDNGPPMLEIVDNVRAWNAEHETARLRIATVSEFFDTVAERYADEIPVFSGDAPNWWTWVFAPSSTRGASLSRTAQMRIPEAEALVTLAAAFGGPIPADRLRRAHVNNLLFEDHNLGGTTPALNNEFWPRKMGWISEAVEEAEAVIRESLEFLTARMNTGPRPVIAVFNPSGAPRTDVVRLTEAGLPAQFRLVDRETGADVPLQRLSSGEIVFVARDVPGVGYRQFEVAPSADALEPASGEGYVFETPHFAVEIDPATGGVLSLVEQESGHELTRGDARFNQYLYNSVGAPENLQIAYRDSGAVLQRVVLRGDAPGSRSYETEVVTYTDLPRVDFFNRHDKSPPTAFEGVDFMFDFGLRDPELRYEIPFGHVRLYEDELSGFRTHHYGVQRWLSVTEAGGFSAFLATRETAVLAHSAPTFSGSLRMMHSFNTSNSAYRAGVGPLESAFSVTTRSEGFDAAAASEFAYGFNRPLRAVVVPEGRHGELTEPIFSRVGVQGPVQLVAVRAPNHSESHIRLFNPNEFSVEAVLTGTWPPGFGYALTPLEEPVGELFGGGEIIPLEFQPFEIKTIALAYYAPPSTEDDHAAPFTFALEPNYPNPFNPSTTFRYQLYADAHVKLTVFDVLGRQIRTLHDGPLYAGTHTVAWDGTDGARDMASGLYLYQLEVRTASGTRRAVRKMMLVR